MEDALPSKKPRFEGRPDFDLAEKADAICEENGWRRGQLVIEALKQYVDKNTVVVPLDPDDKNTLSSLAEKHNRPIGYEGRHAILQYIDRETNKQSE